MSSSSESGLPLVSPQKQNRYMMSLGLLHTMPYSARNRDNLIIDGAYISNPWVFGVDQK